MKNIHVKKNTAKIIVRKLYYILHTKYIYDDIYDNLHDFFFLYQRKEKNQERRRNTLFIVFKRKRKISILPNMKKLHGEGGEKKLTKVRTNR